MKELGVTASELTLPEEAGALSNNLIKREEQAMNSIRRREVASGPFKPAAGESTGAFAIRILFDRNYHNEVTRIMGRLIFFITKLISVHPLSL